MNHDRHTRCSVARALLLCLGLWGAAGCSATQAAHQGTGGSGLAGAVSEVGDAPAKSGEAIAQTVECNQTDSSISCCLKQNPGQYARCGALPPKQAPKQKPKNVPDKLPPLTELSPEEAQEREKKCRDYWYQCIALGGEYEKRGEHGKTICQSCYLRCKAEGYWPDEVNGFKCLGGF